MKPSVIKLKPGKNYEKRGKREVQALFATVTSSKLSSTQLKLQRRKKFQMGLTLFQLLTIVLLYTEEPLKMPSVYDMDGILPSDLPTVSVTKSTSQTCIELPLWAISFHLTQRQGHHGLPTEQSMPY